MAAPVLVAIDPATSAPRGLELAAGLGAGLLVLGSAAHGDPGFVTRGRTADRLLNGATTSVAVVPSAWAPPEALGRVAAGFVDTEEGRAAISGAHALAKRSGARLRILAVVRPDAGQARVRAQNAAEASASGLVGAPVDIDVELAEPAQCLLEASAAADALVCGGRGYGAQPATLLGGVTRLVTARAECPVIVLARGAEVPLDALLA